MTFIAQRHGPCSVCGQDLKGTESTFAAFDEVVHVKCPPDPSSLEIQTTERLCPDCFTTYPSAAQECPNCA